MPNDRFRGSLDVRAAVLRSWGRFCFRRHHKKCASKSCGFDCLCQSNRAAVSLRVRRTLIRARSALTLPPIPMRRLDQLLANLGYGSRREAHALVDDGRVTVAGEEARDASRKVDPATVRVDGEPLDHPDGLLLLLHKPVGLVCSHDEREGPNVYSLLPDRWRRRNPVITSIGRLDKDTSGLLLLTDQSPLVHRLTSPKHKVAKYYRATLDRDLPEDAEARFASGTLQLDGEDKPCAPAALHRLGPREADVVLTEGKYHQVRRMFAACGATVLTLHRHRFGELELGSLSPGKWRELPLDTFGVI